MQAAEKESILTIALLAAFAVGKQHDAERNEARRAADALGSELNAPLLYQRVLMNDVDVARATAQLSSPQVRTLAYEIAVGVCDADGLRNAAETRFLAQLGNALGLAQPEIAGIAATADALATAPLSGAATGPVVAAAASIDAGEIEQIIIKAAVINGALELLPKSLALMAIIPLQMKLVYRIAQTHGYELDRDQIKELLATLGVGVTGQYLEQVGRKLIGGLLGGLARGPIGSVARGATGAAFSFASTYAIGQVARRYYAGGRAMNAELLKQAFGDLLQQGRALQARYVPQIEQQARALDVTKLVQFVRGG